MIGLGFIVLILLYILPEIVNNIVADVKSSIPVKEGGEVYYPGELELLNIKQNKEEGIPVIEEKWEEVLNM